MTPATRPSAEVVTQPPTSAPLPTDTPAPTATLAPTATPEGQIFRDDFTGALQPGWSWQHENAARWSITEDGWLQILGEDASLLSVQAQSNLLWHDLPVGDFVITVHLQAIPMADFHQAAIFIYEDPENYITINRGYCSFCLPGANGVYMDYKIGGAFGNYKVAVTATDLYLRLESTGETIAGYYALAPDQWQRVGRFGNYFAFNRGGIGVANVDAPPPDDVDLAGRFDYFEITRP